MDNRAVSAFPLDPQQSARVQDAVTGLSSAQLQWVSGYAAGLAAAAGNDAMESVQAPASPMPEQQLTVLYGSQTGNGEAIAQALALQAIDCGFAARAVSLADFKPAALKREQLVTFVVSTHGEGDPPDDAELFHEFVMSDRAPKLAALRYSVLALGDSSYVNFCQTGREFDARLAELGAERFEPLVECDLDYDVAANAWTTRVLDQLPKLLDAGAANAAPRLHAVASTPAHGRDKPFAAEVHVNQKITGSGSSKDVRHIELSLEGSGIAYEPGDSLAVVTHNPPQLVDEFLAVLGEDGDTAVTVGGQDRALRDALTSDLEITALSLGFLKAWANAGNSDALHSIMERAGNEVLSDFLASHQVIDAVRRYPADVELQSFIDMLRKLGPRSYSIACSAAANPGEVHLTVAAVRYEAFGRPHWGAASTMLVDRVAAGDEVSIFVEPNPRFRLPAPDTPIIMIGPGTGVAPFRAFVEERAEQGASGASWLFFGDRTAHDDFLYQLEWQRHLKQGNLARLDVAFSRDRRRKVYVQDRMREYGAEVYRWIEDGAVVYVCGDAKRMASDVDAALHDIIMVHGGIGREDAARQLKEMRRTKRYQRDVY